MTPVAAATWRGYLKLVAATLRTLLKIDTRSNNYLERLKKIAEG